MRTKFQSSPLPKTAIALQCSAVDRSARGAANQTKERRSDHCATAGRVQARSEGGRCTPGALLQLVGSRYPVKVAQQGTAPALTITFLLIRSSGGKGERVYGVPMKTLSLLALLLAAGCSSPRYAVHPIEPVGTHLAIKDDLENVNYWLNWCAAYPNGGSVPDSRGGWIRFNADDVKAMRERLQQRRVALVIQEKVTNESPK